MYPQIVASKENPENSYGCWDGWGFNGPNYDLKSGPQIEEIMKMVQDLAKEPENTSDLWSVLLNNYIKSEFYYEDLIIQRKMSSEGT